MRHFIAATAAGLLLLSASAAWAKGASQREYKRGYADCMAGRWDENQHGASYKKGCRAAEDKRNAAGGAAPAAGDGSAAAKPSSRMPSKNEQVCLQAVTKQTQNGDVVLLSSESSEANDSVIVGVGPNRARWRCLVKDGVVAEVMSLTNEGNL